MSKQIHKPKPEKTTEKVVAEVKPNPEVIKKAKRVSDNAEAVVEKIDSLLGEQAEQFFKSFVQVGGE